MSIEEWLASGEYSQVECYEIGYKEAIDKACKWMRTNLTLNGEDNETIIEFRKSMEG